ncbi:sugar ABC transporter ATP-binding protein [Glaciihabitans sp. dw_435]|uniref:sugar ABC transporter ATP-binding protein n=1 Tax=Glaciihabitans sp. dw_435 TaxID=2720081 RepID=UPI002101F4E4|nr:sugar ABC transporter ATP-binding protein [Glaciihabitans sp. dw_435]
MSIPEVTTSPATGDSEGGGRQVASLAGVPEVVSLTGLSVAFGSNLVLRDVTLAFRPGEITALLGANGAGKSTMIKALSGANPRYQGTIAIDGTTVHLSSPVQAKARGISTVHQKVADGIVPGLSVAENVTLDDLASAARHPLRSRRAALTNARAALATLGIDWPDSVLVRDAADLSISDAQLLILARALRGTPRLLILDEPTSALTASEADRLFGVLRALRTNGLSIVYVSHRFGEIEALADRVVVLRDGVVKSDTVRPFEWHEILHDMLGRATNLEHPHAITQRGSEVVARVTGATLLPESAPLSLAVRGGEVLGILGLIGAGKSELAELLAGLRKAPAGTLELAGAPYAPKRPSDALRAGVVLVPEDRQRQSVLPGWSLIQNISLPYLRETSVFGMLVRSRETERAETVIASLDVVTKGAEASIDDLSGGNQQKVVVGRWLSAGPKLAILDEPFRGVDIAARREIGARLGTLATSGAAAIVLSSDVDEILEVADRIIVLVAGEIVLDVYSDQTNREALVAAFLAARSGSGADSGSHIGADASSDGDAATATDSERGPRGTDAPVFPTDFPEA